jgi:hypothetical protein
MPAKYFSLVRMLQHLNNENILTEIIQVTLRMKRTYFTTKAPALSGRNAPSKQGLLLI